MDRATRWLAGVQNPDGGWGGGSGAPSTTEETALAVEALAGTEYVSATDLGVAWLVLGGGLPVGVLVTVATPVGLLAALGELAAVTRH